MMAEATQTQIKRKFEQFFNGQTNFMTPQPIYYGQRGNFLYEISHGRFIGQDLYGITVLQQDLPGEIEHRHDLSASFHTEIEAKTYAKHLGEKACSDMQSLQL